MKPIFRSLALAGALLACAGAASAAVTVSFDHPEKFTDLPFAQYDRDQVLRDLSDHFIKLGNTLPPGQDLRIEVRDVDLAGRLYPSRTGEQIRILKDQADWPTIRLHYSLEAGGQPLRSGDAQLSDMMYMGHFNRYSDGDPLRYEKQMIDDWFGKTFGVGQRQRK